jgi:hypothetical protein
MKCIAGSTKNIFHAYLNSNTVIILKLTEILYLTQYFWSLSLTRPAWAGFKTAEEGRTKIL